MSRIFIDRPIFAWVLAIIVMLAGIGALALLPNEQYPDIAPTEVNIRASYPGASAETVENSVTQIIEQQLTGIDGLLYFSSQSTNRGQGTITAVFSKGTDPDIAQVQVQNKVQTALSRLPQSVQNQGVRVTKSNPDQLLVVAVFDETDTRSNQDVSDYLTSNMQDPLSRVEGVGDVHVFGSPHAMRIWLDPARLAAVSLMPSDVIAAIKAQNTEVAAGEVGGLPSTEDQALDAIVTAGSRLQTPDQFRSIVVKTKSDGSAVTIGDVARVEIGAEDYSSLTRVNGHPGAGISISLSPGADALQTAERVKKAMNALSPRLPDGLKFIYANDSTTFIKLSISEVAKALFEAIVLVVLVMFIFLQSWRATLIPAIAVPVVLLGTFGIFYLAGFSINTMTLFGLVLAIGLLVDDAIVVVENVERLMEENPGMSAREATILSMQEIQVALVAIALVLSAVFLPMAFFGGSTGVIYRQFSLTIVSAMVLSVLVALILSPALTSTLLKPRNGDDEPTWVDKRLPWLTRAWSKFHNGFNRTMERGTERYGRAVERVVEQKWRWLGVFAIVCVATYALFIRLPTGFLPNEDQGSLFVQWRLPAGTPRSKTEEVQSQIDKYFIGGQKPLVSGMLTISGGGLGASGQNTGSAFLNLVDWDQRPGDDNTAQAIANRASAAFSTLRNAQVFALVPGSIRGLGQNSGFTMELQNSGGLSRQDFAAARDKLLALANSDSRLAQVRLSDLPDVSTLKVDTNTQALSAFGLSQSDVNATLSTAWGGNYVNDFLDEGRIKKVYVQGEARFRSRPEDLNQWFVRGSSGQMAPFSAFSHVSWSTAPSSTSRFNGLQAYEFSGTPAPGLSSGTAMEVMEELASKVPGTSVAWAGSSYQERLSTGQGPLLYGLSLLVVFLCLAALYESWSIPIAVILVIPLGLLGAIVFVTLRGLENDVYLQIGLLTTMGLAAKNAILMIEFAEQAERQGKRVIDAALEAARIRLRPILMTSFAFIFGVLPLAAATGAGANSRVAIGTAVVGGMLTATVLAIFYIPLFFVLVRRGVRDGLAAARRKLAERRAAAGDGA
ncbi:efflux RND transporter permease subunit [Novosphingobium pentaromativorans]|uniref:Efflux pump membrane transporter n=1 Tax=Novosphingobium pentaromativorans US6-1 TaxID=1088721 RepID=G6EI82_9SPHN|nr:efflux RND transporter permease subunit [Novosphingobium pentaromativorans]AIT78712.1 multidrug transporter [Novosphingobium pentaromativorans US6-1]EHJ58824.1 hydrophobe/amphiphile efflux-1 (HAE1) family protein [Novosphingobium pentaromativorans US6-1]